jgi:hypothetical protein
MARRFASTLSIKRGCGDDQPHAADSALDEKGREQRWVLRRLRDEAFFFHRDRQVALVRRRAHRVRARRLSLALQVLEKRGESIERLELVRIDRKKMPGFVIESVIAGEQHQRRRIGRLHDHVGDHHLELLDAFRGRGGGFVVNAQGSRVQHVFRRRATGPACRPEHP